MVYDDISNQDIREVLKEENIKYDEEMLNKVLNYCSLVYKDKIKANIPMIEHVKGVAFQVAKLRLDDVSIYASLLHGVVKSEKFDKVEFEKLFSKEILDIVLTVDKLSCLNLKTKEKVDSENLRKMFMAIAKDIRTVIIKLADRLYNMQHIKNIDNEEVKKNMAKECLSIYAPIAHRLGMSQIKSELEDISFRVLLPDEYHMVKTQIDEKKEERKEYIRLRIDEIEKALKAQGIVATVYGRPKHFYSIYKKMMQKGCRADDLFDLLAIRIIVNSIKDCYTSLGIVHDMYKPMPGRFKDYIAVPKTNMYQSLHTTVFGEGARPFEIQIRTWDMHKVADYGIAAHFAYKEKKDKQTEADKKLVWLRQTLEIQKELVDNSQNLKRLKVELFGEEVFVFTPKGDIKALPKGSTPIDFAYLIHQKVAEKMIGAKINSKMVPLSTKLENTDIVEIVTSKTSKGPSSDWLKFVKTTNAKNKITSFLKEQGKEENIVKGKEQFEKCIKKQKDSKEILKEKYVNECLKKFSFKSLEDCYENIGFGSISPVKVVNRLVELYQKDVKLQGNTTNNNANVKHKNNISDAIIVENIKNCKIQLAKCCMPVYGDNIVGYITNAKGVSIHRVDCKSFKALNNKDRTIKVSWKKQVSILSTAKIRIRANNRDNLLNDILVVLNELKLTFNEINTKVNDDREFIVELNVNISDLGNLQNAIRNIKKVDGVFEVKRIS